MSPGLVPACVLLMKGESCFLFPVFCSCGVGGVKQMMER